MAGVGEKEYRTLPFCRVEAESHLGCKLDEASYMEIGSDEQPLFQYAQRHVSKLLSENMEPSFSSSRPGRQRMRAEDITDALDLMDMVGKGKGRGRKRKRSMRDQWPKPLIGLGWHRLQFKPSPPDTEKAEESTATASASAGGDGNDETIVDGSAASSTAKASTEKESCSTATAPVSNGTSADTGKEQPVHTVWVLLQTTGDPVQGEMGAPTFFTSLVLFVKGSAQVGILRDFCCEAAKAATQVQRNVVSIWRYDARHHFWQQLVRRQPRALESVIMDKEQRRILMDDLSWFLKDETANFYAKHGIPYHRSYLFHGPPGTGKTSSIFALAGHFKRNICFLQFDKSTTDDSFRIAVSEAPGESIIVMEDVDVLFTVHRESADASNSLSFSGFLNALDGLGAPEDVIFILTTNHVDRLDPAILRPGRVDVRVTFRVPTVEMSSEYFMSFFPDCKKEAAQFVDYVSERLQKGELSMAQLQHFFLECHRRGLEAQGAADLVKNYKFERGGSNLDSNRNMIL